MVLVVFERANTHCCDRESLQATLKTFGTALASVSRQKVVARFWNADTVHDPTVEAAGSGQATAPEGCGVGSGGHGGGHGEGDGQMGMTLGEANAPVIGQTMAPEGCGVDRTGHGGGHGGGQVGTGTGDRTGPVAGGVAVSGQAMTSSAAKPAAVGVALAIAGSVTAKTTDATTATTPSIPRVMLAIFAMGKSPFLVGMSNHLKGSCPKANNSDSAAKEQTALNPTRDSYPSATR